MTRTGRGRLQFSSRALIFLILILSPALAFIASVKYEAGQFRRALEKVRPDFDLQIATEGQHPTRFTRAIQSLVDRDAYAEVLHLNWNGDRHVQADVAFLIPKFRGIRSLRFSKHDWRESDQGRAKVNWSDNELKQIATIDTLQSITLDGVFSAEAIEPLLQLPLYQLLLPDTPLDDALAQKLLRCETLTSVGFDFRHTPPSAIESVARLPRLSHLTVRYATAGKSLYAPLKDCRKLKAVLIYDSTLAADDGEALSRLKLMQVQLIDCQIAPGFFTPFVNDSALPAITICSARKFETYSSRSYPIALMEERFTTQTKNTAAGIPPTPMHTDRQE